MTRAADACPSLAACVDGLALTTIQRHVFICADQTKPKCCDKADSIVAWDYLKNRLKEKSNLPEIMIQKDYGNLPLVEC